MGYKTSRNINSTIQEINAIVYDVQDNGATGFVQWPAKQDLYRLKWFIDDAIKQCPTFSMEDEWLREQEKERLIKILKHDIQ
jgi:tellurite resistance protein